MASKSQSEAAERNAHTPRTAAALDTIANQLANGEGQVETGTDVSMERQREEALAALGE